MDDHTPFIPYSRPEIMPTEMLNKANAFYQEMDQRRSVRHFSNKPVEKEVIEQLIKTASTAPSGAHKQPWVFCAVSNQQLKSRIREAAEKEERISYESRMSEEWKKDLEPMGTDSNKPFLEIAPWLIILFKKPYDKEEERKRKNYYVPESVGIAAGMLITAIHNAGLVTLTHTPSPMGFLRGILNRPENERAFLLLPVGFPAKDAQVPNLRRKSLDEIAVFYE